MCILFFQIFMSVILRLLKCVLYAFTFSLFLYLLGEVRDMPVALHIPVLYPCMPSEQLRITIDSQRGTYLASLPSHGNFRLIGF